jgi:Zn-dependent protease with chaperone function
VDSERFQAIVDRLEGESAQSPGAYRLKVGLLVGVGFAIIALLLVLAGAGLALLVGGALAVALTGGAALILLLKFGKFLLLLAVPLWYLVSASVRALLIRLPPPEGRRITRAEAPALFAAIDDMRTRMRGPRFHEVLIVDGVNAAVMQRPAFGLFGFPRNYLLLGLPLLESLPPQEALAVVAHEYGHLAGSHGRFSAYVYRLRHTWGTVQDEIDRLQGWLGRLVAPLVRWYAPYFNAYTFVLARANEYEADAASAELVGAAHAAHALKRVNIVAPLHDGFMDSTFERVASDAAPPPDLLQRWAERAVQPTPGEDAQRWLASALDRERHFMDTHPTLRARLDALAVNCGAVNGEAANGESLQDPPPPFIGDSAAVAWLGASLPTLRDELQSRWAASVAEPWAARHAQRQQQVARHAALRDALDGDATRHAEDGLEFLQLTRALEPGLDLREALARYNAAFADVPAALYLEGCARLAHDDDAGIALLERTFALDPEATKPACEQVHRYLMAHAQAEAAERYATLWRERDAFEAQRAAEYSTFDARHALVAPETADDAVQGVRALLAQASMTHVAGLYFARRVLPSDADVRTYVLAVHVSWFGRRLGRQRAIIDRLAAIEWPVHLFVLTLDGQYSKLLKQLRGVPGARVR